MPRVEVNLPFTEHQFNSFFYGRGVREHALALEGAGFISRQEAFELAMHLFATRSLARASEANSNPEFFARGINNEPMPDLIDGAKDE